MIILKNNFSSFKKKNTMNDIAKTATAKFFVKLMMELIKFENCVMPTTETSCEEIFFVISSFGDIRLYRTSRFCKYLIGSLKLLDKVSVLMPESSSACLAIIGTISQNIRKIMNIMAIKVISALNACGNSNFLILMLFSSLTKGCPIIESTAATRM